MVFLRRSAKLDLLGKVPLFDSLSKQVKCWHGKTRSGGSFFSL
jgi:hypothetical protein